MWGTELRWHTLAPFLRKGRQAASSFIVYVSSSPEFDAQALLRIERTRYVRHKQMQQSDKQPDSFMLFGGKWDVFILMYPLLEDLAGLAAYDYDGS